MSFLRRESALLIPVALATYGPAQIMLELAMNVLNASVAGSGPAGTKVLLIFPAFVLILFGNIAVTRLALLPGTSVGEALSTSLRRVGMALLTFMALGLAVSVAASLILIAATLGAMTSRSDPASGGINLALTVVLLIPVIVLSIRLMLLLPVIAMENGNIAVVLQRAWNLGRGNASRLFAIFLLAAFVQVLVATLSTVVIGALAALLRLVAGGELAMALELVVNGAMGSLLMLFFAVYLALVYRALVRV